VPLTSEVADHGFFAVENGRRVATPLLLALIAIELSDIMFAVDSIPAVFAISHEPFIVFTSNVFAILGLRALYLVLADVVADLKYLHYGLGALLLFVGAKMLSSSFVHMPNWLSLVQSHDEPQINSIELSASSEAETLHAPSPIALRPRSMLQP